MCIRMTRYTIGSEGLRQESRLANHWASGIRRGEIAAQPDGTGTKRNHLFDKAFMGEPGTQIGVGAATLTLCGSVTNP